MVKNQINMKSKSKHKKIYPSEYPLYSIDLVTIEVKLTSDIGNLSTIL